jgi:alcohol dehydrogenase class IV
MQRAANLAGQAINVAKTTAPHAWSYGFSSNYDVPHGHAVWLTLPKIYEIHANPGERKINDLRGKEHLDKIMIRLNSIFGINKNNEILDFFYDFLRSIEINHDFDNLLNLSNSKKISLIKSVNEQRMSNNPIYFESKDTKYIFSV